MSVAGTGEFMNLDDILISLTHVSNMTLIRHPCEVMFMTRIWTRTRIRIKIILIILTPCSDIINQHT